MSTSRPDFYELAAAAIEDACLSPRSRIALVIGDGIQPMDSIRRSKTIQDIIARRVGSRTRVRARLAGLSRSRVGKDRLQWKFFEFTRYVSANEMPNTAYFYVHWLASLGGVDSVTTTNYDLCLDAVFRRFAIGRAVRFNPVGVRRPTPDTQGYSMHQGSQRGLSVWKIHGSLSHVSFRECGSIFRLPDFLVGHPEDGLVSFGGFKKRHFPVPADFGSGSSAPACRGQLCRTYVHHADTSYPTRDRQRVFGAEIDAALGRIERTRNVGSVFLLGFKGGAREELNDVIRMRAQHHTPVFAFFTNKQAQDSPLRVSLETNPYFSWSAGDVPVEFTKTVELTRVYARWRPTLIARRRLDWPRKFQLGGKTLLPFGLRS